MIPLPDGPGMKPVKDPTYWEWLLGLVLAADVSQVSPTTKVTDTVVGTVARETVDYVVALLNRLTKEWDAAEVKPSFTAEGGIEEGRNE